MKIILKSLIYTTSICYNGDNHYDDDDDDDNDDDDDDDFDAHNTTSKIITFEIKWYLLTMPSI